MKKAENDMTGNQEVTEHVDMVGWGVEEADARNKKEASMSPFPPHVFLFPLSKLFSNDISRSGNTTCTSLRNPQILHLHSGPSHHFHNTKSREGSTQLGMGYRKTNDEGGESDQAGHDPGFETGEEEVMVMLNLGIM
jgi:hypothetical protein